MLQGPIKISNMEYSGNLLSIDFFYSPAVQTT